MRLCFVTFEYPPVTHPTTGGVGRWAAALAPAMAARGHDVHVLTWGERTATPLVHADVKVHLRPRLQAQAPVVRTAARTVAPGLLVRRHMAALGRFDLVIAPEWGGEAWLYAVDRGSGPLLTQLAGPLAVLAPYVNRRDTLIARFHKLRERFQAVHSDAVGSCSRALLDAAREIWDLRDRPTFVLPNSIDVRRIRQLGDDAPRPVAPGIRSVAYTGRLEPRKGVHVLVESMRQVWTAHPDVELLLIGGDCHWEESGRSAVAHLRDLAGANGAQVRFIGQLPQAQLFPMLARADVVATPSLWEPFGLATLEAMALGVPVVATTGSGFSDFVRDGQDGFLVAPDAAGPLAEAIERLLADEALRTRVGASAAERAEEFDVTRLAELHEVQYATVIARSK